MFIDLHAPTVGDQVTSLAFLSEPSGDDWVVSACQRSGVVTAVEHHGTRRGIAYGPRFEAQIE